MAEAEKPSGDPYTAYVVRCADGSLYTGIAKDVEARVKAHNSGKGAAYTRTRRPVVLLYQEACADRSSALMREIQIKRLPKEKKEKLVSKLVLLCVLGVLCGNAFAQDTVLSVIPKGYEIDRIEETGRGTLPRIAWSNDVDRVLYVAIKGGARKLAVNDTIVDVDSVGPLGFAPDGKTPVIVVRARGRETLQVGASVYGPYEAIERPALNRDGSHAAFFARDGKDIIAVQDGATLARAPRIDPPVLDAEGKAAFWIRDRGQWTLMWKGKAAPGTPFKALGGSSALPDVGQPVFSADGKHVAFMRRQADGRAAIVRDGQAGASYVTVGDPVFSPDGASLAYGAAAGPDYEINTLVLDGRPIGKVQPEGAPAAKTVTSAWGFRYLEDGRLTWSATLAGGRSCFLLGDKASPEYESVGQAVFDPGSKRAAFAAHDGKITRVVADGIAGPAYDGVTFLEFDPEGRRFVYTAKVGTATVVVLNGTPGDPFDEVGWVRFPPGGDGIAYWARTGTRWQTVVNGVRKDVGVGADLVGNLVLAGKDGATPVYSVREDGSWYLNTGRGREGPFDEIGIFTAVPGQDAVLCGTREGDRFHRRLLKTL